MDRILLVASECPETLKIISALGNDGYEPLLASDLERAQELCALDRPILVLLELAGLNEAELRDFTQECHEGYQAPVLGLVAEGKVEFLPEASGLQDFLFLPVRPQELALRVRHVLGKGQPSANSKSVLKLGDLFIDMERYEVVVRGSRVDLTYKEYELLKFLASHAGRVFTREELLNRVWAYDYFGGTRTVDVHVRRLRSKIEGTLHTYIDTVRNVGYRFKPQR